MKALRDALGIIRQYWKAYLTINLLYYGIVIACMIVVAFQPDIQKHLLESTRQEVQSGTLSPIGSAYAGGNVLKAMLVTFFVNLLFGSVICITVPSLIVPFSGMAVGIFRAVLWGLLLSPADPGMRGAMIPHSLTLLLEGQGYILAMFAAYVSGKAFLWPRSVEKETHRSGYVLGLKQTASLYVLVTSFLAVAAVYEALEVIYLVPLFR